jgi:hypothetical protein
MVFDTSTPRLPWFERYMRESQALTIFGDGLPGSCDYRFRTGFAADHDALCSLATVAGAALDMLRRCHLEYGKPHTVYLCGCDFGYGYYFKRGENGERLRCCAPDTWGQKPHMDKLIVECQRQGMQVYTLSQTELEVPTWPFE